MQSHIRRQAQIIILFFVVHGAFFMLFMKHQQQQINQKCHKLFHTQKSLLHISSGFWIGKK